MTETKTGTVFELNQKTARRITDITGVERISVRGNCKKSLKKFESEAKKPVTVPRNTVIVNDKRILRRVCTNSFQKYLSTKRVPILFNTS